VEILPKKRDAFSSIGRNIKDISKFTGKFKLNKKQSPKIKILDIERRVTVPLFKTDKITNPKYLSYNENVRQRIRQQAYSYVDHPEFDAGEVYLTFVLISDGSLKQTKVIEDKTAANPYLRTIGLRSIKEANPFPPFPKDLNYPELTFNVVISFEVKE